MIETHDLRRDYGKTTALHDLTLRVNPGEILGFLGPNGAGKSTTVKILAGMLKPTAGRATVAGFDVATQAVEVKRRMGYVPEAAVLYDALTAREYLQLVASLHHQPFDEARRRIGELLEQLDLSAAMDQRLGEFSKGMRQKVLIASALLHRPDVVFLDEPLTGLDANAALIVKELIRSLAAQGRTIFFCSHVLEVVERICARIVIIDKGRVVADGTSGDIAANTGTTSLEAAFIALTGSRDTAQVTQDLLRSFGDR
ncbi:MAG TPA: ABC transporter ATP-binding protein [Vicinamibacterales bacterium]|nr:ABC transporter ATP-binding protein [Vicinamibacterales bacterium]